MSSHRPVESSSAPEKKVIPIHVSETWMRQCANRCREEVSTVLISEMDQNDKQAVARIFVRDYLAMPDSQWSFPEGEEGIENMQKLVIECLFFLNNDTMPTSAIANDFMHHAMYAYRQHLAAPAEMHSSQDAIEKMAQAVAYRLDNPGNALRRTAYFNELSAFGKALAPNAACMAAAKGSQFSIHILGLFAKVDMAIKKIGLEGLDPPTRSRLHTAVLVGLENMRQQQPPSKPQQKFDLTKQLKGDLRGRFGRTLEDQEGQS